MPLNKVMLIGNVGKDPEVRYLETPQPQQGQNPKVAQFTLATSEKFRDRSGEVRENTEWHNIVAWRGLADLVEKYARKGTQLYVEGKIRTRSWNDQNGAKQYRTEIVADNIQLLGRKSDNQGDTSYGYGQAAGQGYNAGQTYPATQSGQAQASPGYNSFQQGPAAGNAGYVSPQAGTASAPTTAPEPPSDDLPF